MRELMTLWAFMTENYTELWINKFGTVPDEENSRSWRMALRGLTRRQINTGFEQAIIQCPDYPPLPPKFRSLCLSNDDDEAEVLFQEVTHWAELDQEEKSRKALFIVQKLDYTNFRRADLKTAKKMFDCAYHKLLKHLSEGNELPEFVLEIEHDVPPPMAKEQLSIFLSDLMKSVDNPQGA